MIGIVGDVHAKFGALHKLFVKYPELMECEAVIQLGDFGLWPGYGYTVPPREILWIDGNHEHFPSLAGLTVPTTVAENAVYIPRGTVLQIDGLNVAFLGGAESIDKDMRTPGYDWFPEESITYGDMMRLMANVEKVGKSDVLLTHCPPDHVVQIMLGKMGAKRGSSAHAVEAVWEGLGKPMCFSGHMHERRTIGNCHVLPELGVAFITESGIR